MAELRIPRAHSNDWYDQLSRTQAGYYYPWQSVICAKNGEAAFTELVREHLTRGSRILEVGCGHGELALELARAGANIRAYDRVQAYIDLANSAKGDQTNLEYLCYDANLHDMALPAEDHSIDLIICRRGPLHWISDARRVCKPGAFIMALSPMEEPIPAWSSKLPLRMHYENSGRHTGSGSIHQSVDNRLHQVGLTLHSGWGFDVPEVFAAKEDLYAMVTWGLAKAEVPPFAEIKYKFDSIFETFAEPDGIHLRHCRYLWQAQIPG